MNKLMLKVKGCKWTDAVFYTLTVLLVLPFFYLLQYALPSADDFSMINYLKALPGTTFIGSILVAIDFYKTWGGGVIGTFLETFLLGFYRLGIPGLHVLLTVYFVLFFLSLYHFVTVFCARFGLQFSSLFLFFLLLVGLNTTTPKQTFYWAVGTIGYVTFFAAMFQTFSCFMTYTQTHGLRAYIGTIVWGIISCNSAPMAGIINLVVLLYLIYVSVAERKLNKRIAVLFLIFFVTALIVCLAPGNFARHDTYTSGGLHVFLVCYKAGIVFLDAIYDLLKNSFLVFGATCLFFVTLTAKTQRKPVLNPILLACVLAVMCYTFIFPVSLGYGGDLDFPPRIRFMMDFVFSFSFFAFSINCAWYLKEKYNPVMARENTPFVVLLFVLFLLCQIQTVGIANKHYLRAVQEIANGNAKRFYLQGVDTLAAIRNSPDADVVVHGPSVRSAVLMDTGLTSSPAHWVNKAVAEFYGKQSVAVIEDSAD